MDEQQQKQIIKQKARAELEEWKAKMLSQNAQRLDSQKELSGKEKEDLYRKNPWQKVVDNVELDSGKYIGDKDVSRMRQVMISRKSDMMQEGAHIMQF